MKKIDKKLLSAEKILKGALWSRPVLYVRRKLGSVPWANRYNILDRTILVAPGGLKKH